VQYSFILQLLACSTLLYLLLYLLLTTFQQELYTLTHSLYLLPSTF
jgi:hypothetical protein